MPLISQIGNATHTHTHTHTHTYAQEFSHEKKVQNNKFRMKRKIGKYNITFNHLI